MPVAKWNGVVLAESDECEKVEGNWYFPPHAIRREHFQASQTQTNCAWKGTASYFDVVVNGQRNKDAAWFYPAPTSAAANIKDYVAFWRGVSIEG
ncbi:hypothetical protein DRW03_34330 [Corallococcus sp. H22C18031201]|uniref:DUF427 domain-containing protein n=1 Tax=Citreicoccus inhibens TaxID=2849499 RepID=UPI000E71F879|nr:DUF427 domain-containing protein [Citreicoccus inhibens]MBU8896667.1 DUF427 domain-containing protein [Citreicoccus inhibens]RJS14738.1 hypothetical protein DRW03_34330 [Corallococcus sp. H22C18031201]